MAQADFTKLMNNKTTRMLRTLIVGGGGFIGSHLVHLMAEVGGRELIVLGRRPEPRFALPKVVRYVAGNVNNAELLSSILVDCEEVIDLAYASVPKTSFDDPINDVLENLPPSVRLLQACARVPLKKMLIVSSGGTVYGNAGALPIDETYPTNPISPYGITKLAVEKYALLFHGLEGLPVVIVRPGNPYGPNQLGLIDQGFIGAAMSAVLHRKRIVVFGERGTVRDYLYIHDLSRGLLAALNHGKLGEIYNIGTGFGHDNLAVLDTLDRIVRRDGFSVDWETRPARSFDVAANVLSPKRLTDISGWRPQIDLSRGLEMSWSRARHLVERS